MFLVLFTLVAASAGHGDDSSHEHGDSVFPPPHWFTAPLLCNCTVGASRFCDAEGQCNAHVVAGKLQEGLRQAHVLMDTMRNERGTEVIMDNLCGAMASVQTLTDIQILDFDNWEPACVQSGERRSCALAPADVSAGTHSVIPAERLNGMIRNFYAFLECDEARHAPTLLKEDWVVCRHADGCNSMSLAEASALSSSAGSSWLLVFVVPSVVGALLLLTAFVVVFGVLRSRRRTQKNTVIHRRSMQV